MKREERTNGQKHQKGVGDFSSEYVIITRSMPVAFSKTASIFRLQMKVELSPQEDLAAGNTRGEEEKGQASYDCNKSPTMGRTESNRLSCPKGGCLLKAFSRQRPPYYHLVSSMIGRYRD